ncbi:MAG: alpha/beta hydrolase [Chloroflexota bacterium]|nr:alpha/beta hydrolase [Chloroflexota bacterium]
MTTTEELRFRAGDLSLAATLSLPDVEGRMPWALLVPSWLPRNRDGSWDRAGHPAWYARAPADNPDGLFVRLAVALAEHGVATLRYDPRGCGESTGSWEGSDLFSRIDDARDAIGAMRSRGDLDLRRTAIVGHGEGAVIALSVAIGDPAIGAVGLIGASARGFRDVLRRGVAERSRTGQDREHPIIGPLDRGAEELIERAQRREPALTLDAGGVDTDLNLAAWEQAFHTPPLALATMLHRHIVLAHGTADAWSDPDESRILAQVLTDAGNDPVLQLVDGAGHDLIEADEAAIAAFAESLVSRMEPRELPPVLLAIEGMG